MREPVVEGHLGRGPRMRLACLLWGAAAALGPVALQSSARAQGGPAAPGDGLAAARALFADAVADEEAGRLRPALDKFLRVKAVRDTAPVEYRIGTCHEGLGHMPPAYDAYRTAVDLGESDPSMADVVQAARARLGALSGRVARLRLVVPQGSPADLSVQVDDTPAAPGSEGQAIALEPGAHTVVATTAGREAFRSQVVLPVGGEASLSIVLSPPAAAAEGNVEGNPPPAASTATLGWILLGGGAVLVAGAGAALLLRHEDIATLNSACPGGLCLPGSDPSHLDSTRDRALAEGPIAAGLAAAGVALAGVGVYFVVTSPGAPPGSTRAGIALDRAPGLALTGRFQ